MIKQVVTTPSKLGAVVLSLFGLPFLGMGLFAAYSFLNAANQPLSSRIGASVFASVFAIIGGGLIFGSWYGYGLQKKRADQERTQSDVPWLWRPDWAAGRAESKNKASVRGWWVGAVLANMLFLPVSAGTIGKAVETQDPAYMFGASLGLVGLLMLFGAIRATLRLKRFGQTYFEMSSTPFSPGGRVAGSIHMQLHTEAAHGVDLKLTCFRRVVTVVGNSRSSQQLPLWEASKNISAASLQRGPLDTTIPVEFQLPPDAFQTDGLNSDDQVFWLLKASADVPGVDYTDEFELPVFRTSLSPSAAPINAFAGATQYENSSPSQIPAEVADDVPEPARHRVAVRDSADGLEFRFRPARNFGRSLLVLSLAAAVTALFYSLLHQHPRPPVFAFAVAGILDFFLLLAVVHTVLTGTRITLRNGVISWRHSILGIGGSHQLQIPDVDTIAPMTGLDQASSSGSTVYSVRLKSKSGKEYTLVDEIVSCDEARWIVAQIEKRAGLRANTQVEIRSSIYGPPPQPSGVAYRSRGTRS